MRIISIAIIIITSTESVFLLDIKHKVRKRIFKRFKEEGIEIPFPHRTVYLREEKDWKK